MDRNLIKSFILVSGFIMCYKFNIILYYMAKTRKVGKRRNLGNKQNSRRQVKAKGYVEAVSDLLSKKLNDVHLRTYGQEFVELGKPEDPSLPSHILSYIPAKTIYIYRLREALVLNKKILRQQQDLINQLEMAGVDGPSTGTRSKGKKYNYRDPMLNELHLEAYHTKRTITTIKDMLSRIEQGNTNVLPQGFKSYEEFRYDKEQPGWNMARMTYAKKYRPPGYPNWR